MLYKHMQQASVLYACTLCDNYTYSTVCEHVIAS